MHNIYTFHHIFFVLTGMANINDGQLQMVNDLANANRENGEQQYGLVVEGCLFVVEIAPVVGTFVQGYRAYKTKDRKLRIIRIVGTVVSGLLDITLLGMDGMILKGIIEATGKEVNVTSISVVAKAVERGLVEVARKNAETRRIREILQAETRPLVDMIERQQQELNEGRRQNEDTQQQLEDTQQQLDDKQRQLDDQKQQLDEHSKKFEDLFSMLNGDGSNSLRARYPIQATDP